MNFNCKQISPLVSMYTNTSLVPRLSLFALLLWEMDTNQVKSLLSSWILWNPGTFPFFTKRVT